MLHAVSSHYGTHNIHIVNTKLHSSNQEIQIVPSSVLYYLAFRNQVLTDLPRNMDG
jgi:hypothetical protein